MKVNKVAEKSKKDNYLLLCKLFRILEGKESIEEKPGNLSPFRGTYTPMKTNSKFIQISNDMIEKIKEIAQMKQTSDK